MPGALFTATRRHLCRISPSAGQRRPASQPVLPVAGPAGVAAGNPAAAGLGFSCRHRENGSHGGRRIRIFGSRHRDWPAAPPPRARGAVGRVTASGLMGGYPGGLFAPDEPPDPRPGGGACVAVAGVD
ncbi:MAG: S-layer homology domain-containing protein [Thermoanaerobacteraceae bacterium]|nr:S-layer homology domain-containing protein [Thermoanaerobacteraceae bacterium]